MWTAEVSWQCWTWKVSVAVSLSGSGMCLTGWLPTDGEATGMRLVTISIELRDLPPYWQPQQVTESTLTACHKTARRGDCS